MKDELLSNVSFMKCIIDEEEKYFLNFHSNNNVEISELDNMETKYLIIDILNEIDETGEWTNIYIEAIQNAHIIYLNELDDALLKRLKEGLGIIDISEFDNSCIYFGNRDKYLFLNYKGNISDVIFTMHEIIHYINNTFDNGSEVLPIVREFPSIFYEMYALNYLNKLGYSKEELMQVYQCRADDTYSAISSIKDIISDLDMHLNDEILSHCGSYIIGTYLARMAMDKSINDKTLLSIMKYITENLSKIDVYDIFNLLKIDTKKRILR